MAGVDVVKLREPLEIHGLPALRWWLSCRGMKVATSMKKK